MAASYMDSGAFFNKKATRPGGFFIKDEITYRCSTMIFLLAVFPSGEASWMMYTPPLNSEVLIDLLLSPGAKLFSYTILP
jgi:hypothetical protein